MLCRNGICIFMKFDFLISIIMFMCMYVFQHVWIHMAVKRIISSEKFTACLVFLWKNFLWLRKMHYLYCVRLRLIIFYILLHYGKVCLESRILFLSREDFDCKLFFVDLKVRFYNNLEPISKIILPWIMGKKIQNFIDFFYHQKHNI